MCICDGQVIINRNLQQAILSVISNYTPTITYIYHYNKRFLGWYVSYFILYDVKAAQQLDRDVSIGVAIHFSCTPFVLIIYFDYFINFSMVT